ncbi:MAG: bifunctional riboflavin kinase/FAD synthetase [Nitrospinae bacterium]|nr:bifunctional riboflavin kinase/FAD synthetase [Nitrospinota bacterium]
MKITRGLSNTSLAHHPVLTIGNFDGQHLGHLALLSVVVESARSRGGIPMVLTFDPHPTQILKPEIDLQFLTTLDQKLVWFEEVGIEHVVILEFTRAFAEFTPEQFVLKILRDGIGVRDLYVGEHFVFGKGRAGRMSDLVRLGSQAHFHVHAVSPLSLDGEVVSSTRIRRLLQAGKVKEASQYLGRFYSLTGTVVEGNHRGEKLGYPTANLRLPLGRAIPADGVYVTTARLKQKAFDSISYIGTRPTFGPGERLLEVHFLDETCSLYGEEIQVSFHERLRGDQTFATPEELAARITLDVDLARKTLRAGPSLSQQGRVEVSTKAAG